MTALSMPPRRSAGPAPLRNPRAVRRTTSIDVSWPDGPFGAMRLIGRARDAVTPTSSGAPITRAEDMFNAQVNQDRTIAAIEATPVRPGLSRLVGKRGGGHLRLVLDDVMPEERRNATPLYLILDDISGASLIALWAWFQWNPNWLEEAKQRMSAADMAQSMRSREGVCVGFAPGSSAFDFDKLQRPDDITPASDLRHPQDPEGWHEFTHQDGAVGMRRARRIDVSLGDVITIDSAFQDSGTTPSGRRAALHEYSLAATADPASLKLLSIEATPRVLPFRECPSATANLARLIGTPLPELREKVLTELRGTSGCTHLNDMLRALADVPALMKYLT